MKTLMLFYLALVLASANLVTPYSPAGNQNAEIERSTLRLTGEAVKVEKVSEDAATIGFDVSLRLTLTNVGNEAIIIYRDKPWLGAVNVARSVEDALSHQYLHRDSAWPNTWGKFDRLELHEKLDQADPPPDITLVLKPGESWEYNKITGIGFEKKESYDGTRKAWSEIKKYNPLWLQVTLEMWPVNVEPGLSPGNPEWGRALRERWKTKPLCTESA